MKKAQKLLATAVLAIAGVSFNASAADIDATTNATVTVESYCGLTAPDSLHWDSLTGAYMGTVPFFIRVNCNLDLPYTLNVSNANNGLVLVTNQSDGSVQFPVQLRFENQFINGGVVGETPETAFSNVGTGQMQHWNGHAWFNPTHPDNPMSEIRPNVGLYDGVASLRLAF